MPNKNRLLLLGTLVYTLVLLYFSLGDADAVLPDYKIVHQDKWMHLLAYILLAFLWGLYSINRLEHKALIISFFATLIFGIVLEGIQEIINSSRTTDVLDLIANCIGVGVGTVIVHYYQKTKVKIK